MRKLTIRRRAGALFAAAILSLAALSLASCESTKTAKQILSSITYTAHVNSLEPEVFSTIYGNLYLDVSSEEFIKAGFRWGDIANVKFLGHELNLPVVPWYSYVQAREPAIIAYQDGNGKPTDNIALAINMGDFTTTYGIGSIVIQGDSTYYWIPNPDIKFPITFNFTMEEKFGYMQQYLIANMKYTDNRDDFENLTDEEFANFRKVDGKRIDKVYRSSTPIKDDSNRNTYADEAARKAGVTVILNLADTQSSAEKVPGFYDTYYSKQTIGYFPMGADPLSPNYREALASAFKFMINNKGIYLIHCDDGLTRTAYMCAILQSLQGASADEVVDGFMESYRNYYGIKKNSERYRTISKNTIVKILSEMFEVDDIYNSNLEIQARQYLRSLGLTSAEIGQLASNIR